MDPEKISKIIKDIRVKSGMTQKDFADKYNVTYQAVSKWENAKNLPDVTILREICRDFNLDINDLIDNPVNKKKNIKPFILIAVIVLIIGAIIFLIRGKSSDFEFKTISASCPNFKVSGTISYSDRKSAIYISNVTYCGGNDENEYKRIECTLFERKDQTVIDIDKFTYDKSKPIKLEDFLKSVNFVTNNYKSICRKYKTDSLFLTIKATLDDKQIEYEIPLSLNDDCN